MKPFIGSKYGVEFPKTLLLAESHYLPKINSGIHLCPTTWYELNQSHLSANKNIDNETELSWINTRNILNKPRLSSSKGHAIYRNIHQAINEFFPNTRSDNNFTHFAFMNTFLRPAELSGKSIKIQEIDKQKSRETIQQVIDIIDPEKVIFISSKSFNAIAKNINAKAIYKTPHPACIWWNRKSKKGTGKQQLINALLDNK
ncbi:hypothetical protein ACYSN2_02925 [Ignatzschineria sp. LJL83]